MGRRKKEGALEEIGRAVDMHERIGGWFAAFGAMGAGVLFWIGPSGIAEEIPAHKTLGAITGAFGFVFLLALALRGQAGYRARSLMMVMLAAVVGGFLVWILEAGTRNVIALKQNGIYATVPVNQQRVTTNAYDKSRNTLAEVVIDGEYLTVDLDRHVKRGEMVEVLYAPDRPNAIVPGWVEKEWLALIDAVIGRWFAIGGALVALFCLLAIPVKLWDTLFGAPRGVDPDEDR